MTQALKLRSRCANSASRISSARRRARRRRNCPTRPRKRIVAAALICVICRGLRLTVAIADVSYYVKPGDALDTAALERSTSVYFPRRVLPMLPPELSNGLCSLNPDVDRCALVCDLVIDAQGAVHTYQFYPAMIHSVARLSYTEAVALMSG